MNTKSRLSRVLIIVLLAALLGVCMVACGKTYTVTFDSAGGSSVASVQAATNETIDEPDKPVKEGFTFVKWIKPDGTDFNFESDVVTGDITLTAVWTTVTFVVSFDTDGGSAVSDQQVPYNGVAVRPTVDPANGELVFDKWCSDAARTREFNFATPISKDTTIYAKFITRIAETYQATFFGYETVYPAIQTNAGGKLVNLPTPTQSGSEFVGWWISDFEDQNKLTCQYIDQVLSSNVTLYPVWKGNAPAVSVYSDRIEWSNMGVTANYRITITPPSGTPVSNPTGTPEYEYDFASRVAGEYKVEVTFNNNTTTVYYNNKALSRVSLFEVNGFEMKFNGVANADKYIISIVCGNNNPAHVATHTDHDNGTSTTFSLRNCDMRPEGITIVVKAMADGYVASSSKPYVFERTLPSVEGLTIDTATERFEWTKLTGATYYMVKINDGDFVRVNGEQSISVKEYGPGDIKIAVYAVAHGWNDSVPVEYTYTKTRLATPSQIRIEGNVLSWSAVDGATGYILKINDTEQTITDTQFVLPDDLGTSVNISVQAVNDDETQAALPSDSKTFSASLEGQVSYVNGEVSWSTVFGASKYSVRINNGTPVETENTTLLVTFDAKGTYTIQVSFLDEAGKQSSWETISVTVYAVTLAYNLPYQGNFSVLFRAEGDELRLPDETEVLVPGYTFGFWSDTTDGTEYLTDTLVVAEDLTLYARWTSNIYKALLDPRGGTINDVADTEEADVVYREKFELPVATPTDPIKAFHGWYTEPNRAGIRLTDEFGRSGSNVWTSTSGMTLYAGWIDVLDLQLYNNGSEYKVMRGPGIDLVSVIKVPRKYNGLPVTLIEYNAFYGCSKLVTIELPDTIKAVSLGMGGKQKESAFADCSSLMNVNVYDARETASESYEILYRSVDGVLFHNNKATNSIELVFFPNARRGVYTVPYGTQVIGMNVFSGYNYLTEVYIPASVREIADSAFKNTSISLFNLEKVEFLQKPENPVDEVGFLGDAAVSEDVGLSIAADAFRRCQGLTTVTIPSRMTDFNIKAFTDCTGLEAINVSGQGGVYTSKDGLLCDATGQKIVLCPIGKTGPFVVPDGITTIGESAFESCSLIESITIPGFVTTIEKNAFKSCSGVTSITFQGTGNDNPLIIGEGAFYSCRKLGAFDEIVLPENLKSLAKNAFGNLGSSVFRVRVNSIGEVDFENNAFTTTSGTSYITEVHLCAGVYIEQIGGVFGNKVATVVIEEGNLYYTSIDDVVYDIGKTRILFYPEAKQGQYTTLPTIEVIGDRVFQGKLGLTSIVIGANVTEIGVNAFQGCKALESVVFADGGEIPLTIGDNAFNGCIALGQVTLPTRLKTIGASAFRACSLLEQIVLPEGVETIGKEAFANCSKLQTISIPASVTEIEISIASSNNAQTMDLYIGCTVLQSIDVAQGNSNYASIDGIFYGKTDGIIRELYPVPRKNSGNQGVLTFPETLTKVWSSAFYENTGLTKIDFSGITDNVEFGVLAFYKCYNVEEIILPDGIQTIEKQMFYQCYALQSITIPNTVTYIGREAFYACHLLSEVTFASGGSDPLVLEGQRYTSSGSGYSVIVYYGVFYDCPALTQIDLPERLTEIKESAFGGTNIEAVDFGINSQLSYIGDYAFCDTKISSISIPKGVSEIGKYAFYRCSLLETVSFADETQLVTIDDYSFYHSGVTSILIPASVETIASGAFQNSSLKTIEFASESKLKLIAYGAFRSTLIEQIEIPASVESIGNSVNSSASTGYVFQNCRALTSVTFAVDASGKSQLKEICSYSFKDTGLTSFAFPESEYEIDVGGTSSQGSQLFSGCSNLTSITVSSSVTRALHLALKGAPALETITIAANNPNYKVDSELPLITNASAENKAIIYVFRALDDGSDGIADGKVEVTVPANTLNIEANAFRNQVYITKVYIPSSVMNIGANAFENCYELQQVEFAANSALQTIGNDAFAYCRSLTSINLPIGIKTFGTYMFRRCTSLQSIVLPADMTTLPQRTFSDCWSLSSVTMPGIKSIGQYAFFMCKSLASIDISKVTTISIWAFNKAGLESVTIPEGIKAIGNQFFSGNDKLETVTLHNGVTSIGNSFADCTSLKTLQYTMPDPANPDEKIIVPGLPSSLKTIGGSAFSNCTSLESIVIPDSVTSLGASAFKGCTSLETATLPSSMKIVSGTSLFEGCTKLNSVTLPSGLTDLGGSMFLGCISLTSIELPGTLAFLGASKAFSGSGLTEITIPDTVKHFGSKNGTKAAVSTSVNIFDGCLSLTKVVLPASLETMGAYVFNNCPNLATIIYNGYEGVEKFALPDTLTIIGNYTFAGCTSIESATLPALTARGSYMFAECSNLKQIVIEGRWTSFGAYMFRNCVSLEQVVLPDGATSTNTGLFMGCISLNSVTLPSTLTTVATSAFRDCESLRIITLPSTLTTINESAFLNSGLSFLSIPKNVKTINASAFGNCKKLTEFVVDSENATFRHEDGVLYNKTTGAIVSVPAGKTDFVLEESMLLGTMTAYAFYGFNGLQTLVIPEGVTSIPNHAFYGFSSLETVSLPSTLTSIGNYAFAFCTSLKSIVIPESVTTLGTYLFDGCTALDSVKLPSTLTALSKNMFSGCSSLKTIELPDSITFMGTYTFQNSGLESIIIPAAVEHMGLSAGTPVTNASGYTYKVYLFDGCKNLASVILPEGLQTMGQYIFSGCESLESVVLPTSLKVLNPNIFVDSGLKTLTIPAGVELPSSAFANCTSLISVEFAGEVLFNSTYVSSLFKGCTSLRSVVLHDSLEIIGSSFFEDCVNLENLEIPASVNTINGSAFANCTSLKSILISAGTALGGSAVFKGWTNEQTVYIEESEYTVTNYWNVGAAHWYTDSEARIVYEYTSPVAATDQDSIA